MPSPTSATLSGPAFGSFGVLSSNFIVTLNQPADPGGVVVTVTDSVGGDTVTTSPFTIASGATTGTFKITPSTYGDRSISIATSPSLTIINSPRTYSSRPSAATLSGPTSLTCAVASSNYLVALNAFAGTGGIPFTVTSSEGSDTITSSSFTIPAGSNTANFTVTPTTCGSRTISISTTTSGITIIGSPITATVPCNCPDDAGTVSRSQGWSTVSSTCPDAFSVSLTTTPVTVWAKELYCTSSALSFTITE